MKNEDNIQIKKPTWDGKSNKNKSVIVLMSGGLDSSVLLYKSLIEYPRALAIGFDYGQRNKSELDAAVKICSDFGVEFRILDATFIKQLSKNCYLLNQTDVMENRNFIVPFRNGFFLEMAMSIAANENYDYVLLGGLLEEISIIDKNPVYLKKLQKIFNDGAGLSKNIEIKMPFVDMYITKNKVFKLAEQYDILEYLDNHVVSCYEGVTGFLGCKKCMHCKERELEYKMFLLKKERDAKKF